ncbi:MAG TPA: zinc ribbon domain-containing protein [Steroidobacteraceae bacterium]|nr:zinc ribbon domain-containing protein [Steroidobacteraceae bacterium]
MPIYEYQCDACGHTLEALQQFADAPLKKCPDCGKSKLRRLLSAPMFLLKGSGWYETDFKSDKEVKRNLADRPEKEESKTESTTAPAASKSDTGKDTEAAKAETKSAPETKRTSVAVSKPGKRKGARRGGLRKARRRRT